MALEAKKMTWRQVQALAGQNAVALLPVGSTEAHGPHLPLNVDVLIAEAVAARTADRLVARGQPTLIFPAVPYGLTDFADAFAGTVSVSADATRAFLTDVLVGIARHGFRRIGVLNHHLEPAHFQIVHEAAKAAAAKSGAAIAVPDHRKKPTGPRLGQEFISGGSHAGNYETSLLLAAAPDAVDELARLALPDLNVDLPAAIKGGARNFAECGGPDAYFGSPSTASREEGERLLEILAEVSEAAVRALG